MSSTGAARGRVDSVLLAGFGGPTRSEEVMPFLERVGAGRGVPRERLFEVAHHYELLGGRSPYNDLIEAQALALAGWLEKQGRTLPVYIGMRHAAPFTADTLARMAAAGRRFAAGIVLATHRSPLSREGYVQDIDRALEAGGLTGLLGVRCLEPWFDDPAFLEACAQRLEQAAGHRRAAWPDDLPVLFTAHSIPTAVAGRSPYVADLEASCRGVADRLGCPNWRLAWQSRSGDSSTPWLEPDILEVLREEAAAGVRQVVVQAIGFLTDHVEVLYDLDIEARRLASGLGVEMMRAACVNAHPAFIEMLGRRVLALADAAGAPR
ncbi:MAG TPA: ferrochelatase [Candidatus Polarisedimenticolia bacterium]|nr:ferrochelatase [Candidatus Polarisedimenticolia bacterium]